MLLDQYKKKAQLYQANVVLAPLGDDFRYEISFETQKQYTNYQVRLIHSSKYFRCGLTFKYKEIYVSSYNVSTFSN